MYSTKAEERIFKHGDLRYKCEKALWTLDIEKQAVKKAFEIDQLNAKRSYVEYKSRKNQIIQDKIVNDLTRQQLLRNQSPLSGHEEDKTRRQASTLTSLFEPSAVAPVDDEDEYQTTFITQRNRCQSVPARKISVLNDPIRPEVMLMKQRKAALQESTAVLQKKMDNFMERTDHFVRGKGQESTPKQNGSFQVAVAQPDEHAHRPIKFIRSQSAAAIVSKAKVVASKWRKRVSERSHGEEAGGEKLTNLEDGSKMADNSGRRSSISRARIDELVYGKSGRSTMVSPNPTTPGERRRSLTFITDALSHERGETHSASSKKKHVYKSSKHIFEENKAKIMDAWLEFTANDNSVEGMKKLGRMAVRGREVYNAERKKSLVNSDSYQQFEEGSRGSTSRRASIASSIDERKRRSSLSTFGHGCDNWPVSDLGLMDNVKETDKVLRNNEVEDVEKDIDNVGGGNWTPGVLDISDGQEDSITEIESNANIDVDSNDKDGVKVHVTVCIVITKQNTNPRRSLEYVPIKKGVLL
jgi:hypothetical protein